MTIEENAQYFGSNKKLLALLDPDALDILDVGCGAGGNANLLRESNPNLNLYGVTISSEEASLARKWMNEVVVADLEEDIPLQIKGRQYDAIICSHVLEHLSRPYRLVAILARLLKPGGTLLIAVPNVAYWRQRLELLRGRFDYAKGGGITDDTHLRFFTFYSAQRYLFRNSSDLQIVRAIGDGHCPLGWIRRCLLPSRMSRAIDHAISSLLPNVFGWQVLIVARKFPLD